MEVVFIRHGQPEWDREGLSVDNPPLTELGHRQAEVMADYVASLEIDELLVSPLVRAQQTAAPLVERTGLEPTTLPWLAEIGAPVWNGIPTEVVQQVFAEERRRSVEELWNGLPGGESFRDFHIRIVTGLRSMLDGVGALQVSEAPPLWKLEQPARRIVVVAHAGTNATAVGHLLGIPPVPWEWERFVSFHASLSVLRPLEINGDHAFSLFRFSDVDHLSPDLRTR
jgi:broad specificity phosphatase PhoE